MAFINPYRHTVSLQNYALAPRSVQAKEAEEKETNPVVGALDTAVDLGGNLLEGAGRSLEGIFDAALGLIGGVGGLVSKDFREGVQDVIEFDVTDWTGNEIFNRAHRMLTGRDIAEDSYLKDGGLIEQIAQGVGGMLPAVAVSVATGGAGAPAAVSQALSTATMATGAAGQATQEAYQDGAGYYQGLAYGGIRGATEVATEKLFGGLDAGLFGKGFLPDVAKSVADTGVKRFVKGALQEGAEEMVSEWLDPAARSVYQGKEAYKKYLDPAFYGDVWDAGVAGTLTGAAFSGTVGRALSGGSLSEDLNAIEEQVTALENKKANLEATGKLTAEAEAAIDESIRENYRLAESVLKAAKEGKRKTALERSALGGDFEADGSLKAEKTALLDAFAEGRRLSVSPAEGGQGGNTAALDGRYVSHRVTGDRAVKALKNGGARALTRELSEAESKEYAKLRRAMRTLDVASGNKLDYVLAEGMADKNAYFDPQTGVVVIGADTLTADAEGAAIKAWGQALVHEVTHTTEGTMGNAALAAQLSSIMGDDALYGELSRRGYFKGSAEETKVFLEAIMEKVEQGGELTAEEADARELFFTEAPALMAEKLLGDGHFIRRLVVEQGSVAEKILVKLTELKESLSRMTSKDAKSLHRAVVKAEELYLKAVEEAGCRFESGKFVGSEDDEELDTVKESKKGTEYVDYDQPITLQDIEILRSIGRKSINAFTSEDIEKAQKWAYKFYKEQKLGTKSPFFRAWFGDWRAYDTKTRKPYVVVNSEQITPKDVSRESVKNQDTGWIIDVNRDGIDETANKNGKWSIAYHSLKNIQNMLANCILMDTVVANDPSKRMGADAAFVHHLYCPVKVDGINGIAKLYVVESYQDRKRFYLTKIEMAPSDSTGLNANGEYVPNSSEDTDISIAEIYEFVKTHDKDFEKDSDHYVPFEPKPVNELMLDENKEPRVLYHGTGADFTAFDYGRIGESTGVSILGDGFYFTDNKEMAARYGKKTMPCYVRMNKPYMASPDDAYHLNTDELEKQGFDGVILEAPQGNVYMAFDNSQIKSATDNIGTFDGRNPDIRYSRKPKSQASVDLENPPTELTGAQRQIVAEHSRPKVYTKAEAVSVIDDIVKILEEVYNEEGGIGEASGFVALKKKTTEAATATLWKSFNKDMTGKERAVFANKLAEAIMKETSLVTVANDETLNEARAVVNVLRRYFRKLDLSGIAGEIKAKGLDGKAVRGRWGVTKGTDGMTADQVKAEIEGALGMTIPYEHEADIFFWINEQFDKASDVIKVTNQALLQGNGVLVGDDAAVRDRIAQEILKSYKEKGRPSEWTKRLLFEVEPGYDTEAESVGITKAKFDAAKALNFGRLNVRAAYLAASVKDWKAGVFLNQSQPKYQNIFNDTIGQLSKINKGGRMLDPVKTRELIAKLSDWYTEENMKHMGITFEPEIAQYIEIIGKGEGALSVADLQYLVNLMEYMKHTAENYQKVYKNGKLVDALPEAKRYVRIMRDGQRLRVGKVDALFSSAYMRMYGDPHMIVRYMDKYQRGFYTEMYERLREGGIMAELRLMDMHKQIEETMKPYKHYFKELEKRKIHLHGADMPVADAMSLYLSLNREQAMKGLLENGYCFKDDDPKQTVRRVFGLTGGENVTDENGQVFPKYRKMIESLQAEIWDQLSNGDQAYMGIVVKLMGDDCKKLKRSTDIMRMGYSNAVESFYYPIRRAYTAQNADKQTFFDEVNRVSNASFNKNTVKGAANQMLIEPIHIVAERHFKGVAMYAGLGKVIDDFNMLKNLNTDEMDFSRNKPLSVASEEDNTWPQGRAYFEKLIADIQGIKTGGDELTRILGKIRGNYAKFALSANPKVIMTQISSVFAAGNVMDFKSLMRGFTAKGGDVFKYCDLAELRAYDNQAARAQGLLDSAGDALMKPIGWTDSFVVRRLFVAAQYQVAKDKHLELNTEENKRAAGELLREVILETQQNALASEKSEAARSTSEIQKMLTMFTSDAVKLTGRLLDAWGEVSVIKRRAFLDKTDVPEAEMRAARRRLGKSLGSLAAVAIYTTLLTMGVRWFLNKDDEEATWLDWLSVFFGSLLGGLPIINDVYERFFGSGYGLEDMSVSAFNDMLDSFDGFFSTMGNIVTGNAEGRDIAKESRKMLYSIGQVTGIPTRNFYNWTRGVLDKIAPEATYKLDGVFYKPSYNDDIKAAIEAEDEDRLSTIVGVMLDENVGEVKSSVVRQEMNRLVVAGMDVLPRGVGDVITYEGQSVRLTAKQKAQFRKVYGEANEAVSRMVSMKLYTGADDEAKAKAIKRLYGIYYNRAIEDLLGVDIENKNVLMSRAVDPAQLSIIAAVCAGLGADVGKDGKAISGSKKAKVISYLSALNLKAAQKHLILGYLGYKNTQGEEKVRAYLAGLGLGRDEVGELLEIGGY